jgi:site-specific DNA-adenine methylase
MKEECGNCYKWMKKSICPLEQSGKKPSLNRVTFVCSPYQNFNPINSVIYCDPPYANINVIEIEQI